MTEDKLNTEVNREYLPFEKKPDHLKQPVKDFNNEHRKFTVTISPTKIMDSFKRCIREGDISEEDMLTVYRVIASELMKNGTDETVIKMHNHIRSKIEEVYERRIKAKRKIK